MISYNTPFWLQIAFTVDAPCFSLFLFVVSRYSLLCPGEMRELKLPSFWLHRAQDPQCAGMPYSLTTTVTWSDSPLFVHL